jgi:hypothetical protein
MNGAEATTKSLSTDDELINETIAAQPDLVSIDSPLSLPEGWQDPDKPCGQPIYRKCELALKRMGISVFWCLLPSMKSLTTLHAPYTTAASSRIESHRELPREQLRTCSAFRVRGLVSEELKWDWPGRVLRGKFHTAR